MRKVRLGKSDLEVTPVCFGAWAIGGRWWGRVDDGDSRRALRAAVDLGINFIDTAPIYGFGHSENLIGEMLAGRRSELIIATKCGLRWEEGRIRHDNSAASIEWELEQSLRRLKTDYIDLYQLHWPDPETPIDESMQKLCELREQGKIRAIGASNFDAALLEQASAIAPVQTLQPPYNLLTRAIERQILPYCINSDVGVLVYEPLLKGLLTGKFDRNYRPGRKDVRSRDPRFSGEKLLRNLDFVNKLAAMAGGKGCTIAQLAVAWVLARPGVHAAICGAKTPEQIAETARAADIRLNGEEKATLDLLSAETADFD